MDWLFWGQRDAWPSDSSEYVFLGRAFEELGRARFRSGWTGTEGMQAARPHARGQAGDKQLLRKFSVGSSPTAAAALLKRHRSIEIDEPAARRRALLTRGDIARHCETGTLVSAWRAQEGGPFVPIPRAAWSTEKLLPRFKHCMMHPDRPFGDGFAGDGYGWIFVERTGFERLIAGCSPQKTAPPVELSIQASPADQSPGTDTTKRGKKRGPVPLTDLDQPLIDEMRNLRQSKTARSDSAAAGMVVHKATGTGTDESKVRRLTRIYSAQFPDG